MTISSVILRVHPEKIPQVKTLLAKFSGVELHVEADDGRLIITIEDAPDLSAADCYLQLNSTNDILSTAVIYEYSGELEDAIA